MHLFLGTINLPPHFFFFSSDPNYFAIPCPNLYWFFFSRLSPSYFFVLTPHFSSEVEALCASEAFDVEIDWEEAIRRASVNSAGLHDLDKTPVKVRGRRRGREEEGGSEGRRERRSGEGRRGGWRED